MKAIPIMALAAAIALSMPIHAAADEFEPCDELEADDWAVDVYETGDGDWNAGESGGQTLNAYDGIYWHGDRLETYYSDSALYHWRTPEWWVDDNGFYRTDEGYFVVAASDYEQGTVIEGSMGLCQVLDSGCPYGVTDYYVHCW